MRLMEVLPLKKEDYDTEAGVFTLTKTKGNKERIVPLHPTLSLQMNKYLNRINTLYPKSIYLFPQDTHLMGKKPYMEASVGIENILNAIRVDYVWRLNYRNHPGIQKNGIRATIVLSF